MPNPEAPYPRVTKASPTVLSPWVTLTTRTVVAAEGSTPQEFHSLQQADYVTILAETKAGEIVLIEQFRPALEARTLEFPGGLRDSGEEPSVSATRELQEEAGFHAPDGLHLLGRLVPDQGRLENHLWAYHAVELDPIPSWKPERGLVRHLMPKEQFRAAIREGRFTMALHIAIVGLAILQHRF